MTTAAQFPGFPPGPGGFPPGGPGGFPGGGGFPGYPPGPGGFPPGGPGGFPPRGPGGPGQGPSTSQLPPPPSFTPTKHAGLQLYAVDPGSIAGCRNRYVYIWQDNGEQYWVYLTFVGRNSVSGYRWFGFGPFGFWFFWGIDLRRIEQFICY